MLLRVVGELNE